MAKRKVAAIRRTVRFSQKVMKDIPQGSIERLIFEKLKDMKVVETAFRWKDVGNVCDLDENSSVSHSENVLKNHCEDVMVINSADRQLVVTNDIQDVVVVNTEDAVYVSSKERVDDIKNIISENKEKYENYFDYNRISYRRMGNP